MDNFKLELSRSHLSRSKSLSSLEILDNVSNGLKVFHERLAQITNTSASRESFVNYWGECKKARPDYEELQTVKGTSLNVDTVTVLEGKIERLSDLLVEQQKFLVEIKKDLKKSMFITDIARNEPIIIESSHSGLDEVTYNNINVLKDEEKENDRANNMFDAIEYEQTECLEKEIKEALVDFLQSDALKNQVVTATELCVRDVIRNSFSQNFSTLYLPILERSHRRLLKHVTKVLEDSFKDLEENSAIFSKSVSNTSKTLRKALERHQLLLEEADHNRNLLKTLKKSLQDVFQKELKDWRENLLNVLCMNDIKDQVEDTFPMPPSPTYSPISPPQPADPERNILEQLMKSAEINKHIKEGNINGSFERALSSSDLSLVMAACRAAEPAKVFAAPCLLSQPVLLSLIQQLATDMVHDTQLKCRYLEEAIINLNTLDAITRSHLPTIVTEVQKHLSKFLKSYPSHVASRRVTLIIMAANDLLKSL